MLEQWFYRIFGQEFGPVAFDELRELATFGSISPTDEVRNENSTEWVMGSSIPELGFVVEESEAGFVPSLKSLNDWYCVICGQELGPLSFDEIARFAEQSQLSAEDQVKLGAGGKWRRVGSIGRLLAAIPYQPAQQRIPEKRSEPDIAIPAVPVEVSHPDVSPVEPVSPVPKPTPPVIATPAVPARPDIPGKPSSPAVNVPIELATPSPPASPVIEKSSQPVVASSNSSSGGFAASPSPYRATAPARPIARPSSRSSDFSIMDLIKGPAGITVGAIALVGLLVLGWSSLPQGAAADIARYQSLKKLLDDVKSARATKTVDVAAFQKRAQELSAAYIPALKHANGSMPARQNLLWAVRDELPKMMAKDLTQENIEEKRFASRLASAATVLGVK